MALSRAQLLKELEPGLHAVFGKEYARYEDEHLPLFEMETSNRAFEEEVLFPGFGAAFVKDEGAPINYAETGEGWVARYNHETIALGFQITEEAMEDNLYDKLSVRLTKMLARSMAHTKQVKAADVYNRAFNPSYLGGDNVSLANSAHVQQNNASLSNILATAADLSEASIEAMLIQIAGNTDDKGIPTALNGRTLHIPRQLVYVAERILRSPAQSGTGNNDLNALSSTGMLPGGVFVNHRFTDADAWFVRTDCPHGMKMFERKAISQKMDGDFDNGNVRYKSRERYSFGWSDWRGVFATPGA